MWWFFALIMLASYTANLAAFLTTDRMAPTINSAEDLVKQSTVRYGCNKAGATRNFFRDSNFSTYARMYNTMEKDESLYTDSNDKGMERVKEAKGKYAFFMESIVSHDIKIAQVRLHKKFS